MNLDFDLGKVTVAEFGVGRESGNGQSFVAVPVDSGVQKALREMAEATWKGMKGEPTKYEPSEKHAPTEYLYLPLNDDLTEAVRNLATGGSSVGRLNSGMTSTASPAASPGSTSLAPPTGPSSSLYLDHDPHDLPPAWWNGAFPHHR